MGLWARLRKYINQDFFPPVEPPPEPLEANIFDYAAYRKGGNAANPHKRSTTEHQQGPQKGAPSRHRRADHDSGSSDNLVDLFSTRGSGHITPTDNSPSSSPITTGGFTSGRGGDFGGGGGGGGWESGDNGGGGGSSDITMMVSHIPPKSRGKKRSDLIRGLEHLQNC